VADVSCTGTWPIDDDGVATCVNARGSIAHIEFETSQAQGEGIQGLIGDAVTACLASEIAFPPE